jgi:ABC-2 type transport system ATP-binding protein
MNSRPLPFLARGAVKRFGKRVALESIDLEIPEGRIIGLLGRNGAGKSTLLHMACGLILPSSGECYAFGVPTRLLDTPQLAQLGLVQQEARYLEWMTVRAHLDFNASLYETWDRSLEKRLAEDLELDTRRKIMELNTGDRQKMGILLAVCHRPRLLLLDEPMSALDPIARGRLIEFLLERLQADGCTVVISSHILTDVEKIIDWVVCLDEGRLVENCAFDALLESFAEWTLSAPGGGLPARFDESCVLAQQGHERMARLTVRTREPEQGAALARRHGAELRSRSLSLDEIFPHITGRKER